MAIDNHAAPPPNTTPSLQSRRCSDPQPIGALTTRMLADLDRQAADPARQAAEEERARIEQAAADQRRHERRNAAMRSLFADRGARYEDCRLDNFAAESEAQRNVLQSVADYANSIAENIRAGRSVVFYGPPGTGKDHLLAALMRCAVLADFSVAWFGGMSLYGSWRDGITNEDTEAKHAAKCRAPTVLAISDPLPPFGDLTPFQASRLFEVLDWRYSHCRPTWLTMNVKTREEALRGLGAAIVDRLRDGTMALSCDWESYRGRKK